MVLGLGLRKAVGVYMVGVMDRHMAGNGITTSGQQCKFVVGHVALFIEKLGPILANHLHLV